MSPEHARIPKGRKPPARRSPRLRQRAAEVESRLAQRYPEPRIALLHDSAWQLLAATILSAQSTDETVNRVTPALFASYPTVASIATAPTSDLERAVHATGFFRAKTRSLQGCARDLLEHHGGEVPDSMEALVALPGVGRKTANVVLGTWFGKAEGVVVDTHVGRLSRRLGLTKEQDPERVEVDLMRLLDPERWTDFSHRLIFHGRETCKARAPQCAGCLLADLCPSVLKPPAAVRRLGARAAPRPRVRRGPSEDVTSNHAT